MDMFTENKRKKPKIYLLCSTRFMYTTNGRVQSKYFVWLAEYYYDQDFYLIARLDYKNIWREKSTNRKKLVKHIFIVLIKNISTLPTQIL